MRNDLLKEAIEDIKLMNQTKQQDILIKEFLENCDCPEYYKFLIYQLGFSVKELKYENKITSVKDDVIKQFEETGFYNMECVKISEVKQNEKNN